MQSENPLFVVHLGDALIVVLIVYVGTLIRATRDRRRAKAEKNSAASISPTPEQTETTG